MRDVQSYAIGSWFDFRRKQYFENRYIFYRLDTQNVSTFV